MTIKIEYENEIPRLRFADIYCPECSEKFDAMENGKTEHGSRFSDYIDLQYGVYKCPHCKTNFNTRGKDLEVKER